MKAHILNDASSASGHRYEVTFTVTPNMEAYRKSGDLDPKALSDWDIEVEEIVYLPTGCCPDDFFPEEKDEALRALLEYWHDNYDPTP